MRWYLDASVAVHVILPTGDHRASGWLTDRHADGDQILSSALLELELARVLRRERIELRQARLVLDRVNLLSLDDGVLHVAAGIEPHVKALDAIHLATCSMLGYGITLVTHDAGMIAACPRLGLDNFDPLGPA